LVRRRQTEFLREAQVFACSFSVPRGPPEREFEYSATEATPKDQGCPKNFSSGSSRKKRERERDEENKRQRKRVTYRLLFSVVGRLASCLTWSSERSAWKLLVREKEQKQAKA